MIDILLKIRCSTVTASFRVLELNEALPEEFEFLWRPAYLNKVVTRILCPCCKNDAVFLLVNWLYEDQQVLLLDSPVIYCLKTNRLLLLKTDEGTLHRRLTKLSNANLVPLVPRRVGIGQRISQSLIGEALQRALNIKTPNEAKFSPEADAVVVSRTILTDSDCMPSALALHSSELPIQMTLKLEPTTRCNFGCEFCYGRHIEQGSLSIDDFYVILDRFPTLKAVELTGEGEPLLNRHIYEMVRKCSERGLWTHLTTNGSLLSQKNCELLLDAGLSSLAISIESLDAIQFARMRPGGQLELVLNGIHTLNTAKKKKGKQLELKLWVTILRETLSEIEKIEAFAREAKVDCVEYQTLNSMNSYTRFYNGSLRENLLSMAEIEGIIQDPDTKPAVRSVLSSLVESERGKRCDVFMNTTMIYWQGSITPCCLLKTPRFTELGNLTAETIEEVWSKTDFKFFRFALQHGIVLKSCEGCPFLAASHSDA